MYTYVHTHKKKHVVEDHGNVFVTHTKVKEEKHFIPFVIND